MATIRIQRDKGWVDMIRRYKIFLNGEEKGSLKQGEDTELSVVPGNYEIFGKIDWCKTKRIQFAIKNNEEKRKFAIYSNLKGIKVFLAAFYSILGIFKSDIWIKIKEI